MPVSPAIHAQVHLIQIWGTEERVERYEQTNGLQPRAPVGAIDDTSAGKPIALMTPVREWTHYGASSFWRQWATWVALRVDEVRSVHCATRQRMLRCQSQRSASIKSVGL